MKLLRDLVKWLRDPVKSLRDLVKSLRDLVKSLWDLVKSLWDLVKSLRDLVKSLWDLMKSLWDLVKSLWDLVILSVALTCFRTLDTKRNKRYISISQNHRTGQSNHIKQHKSSHFTNHKPQTNHNCSDHLSWDSIFSIFHIYQNKSQKLSFIRSKFNNL